MAMPIPPDLPMDRPALIAALRARRVATLRDGDTVQVTLELSLIHI